MKKFINKIFKFGEECKIVCCKVILIEFEFVFEGNILILNLGVCGLWI